MPVTLQQIAEAAGVSRGTVDRALKDRGRVRPEVAEKIKNIAKEMGYQPSLAGRALVMAKRNLKIGIIMQSAQTPFMVQVYEGMKAAKQEVESLGGTVEIFRVDGVDAGRVMEIMQEMKEQEYSGIALSPSEDTMLKKMINQFSEEYGIPIITFNSDIEDTKRICFVGQNTIQSGRTAAGLMGEITGGKGEVAVISGHISNPALNNRIRGFQSEILESFPGIQLVGTKYSYDDEWVAAKIVEELLEQYRRQLREAGDVRARPMFGEYGLYCDGVFFAVICDDQLFVKPTPQGEAAFPRLPKAPPYEGAKDYLLAEDVDDREGLTRLVRVTCEALRTQSVRKRRK